MLAASSAAWPQCAHGLALLRHSKDLAEGFVFEDVERPVVLRDPDGDEIAKSSIRERRRESDTFSDRPQSDSGG